MKHSSNKSIAKIQGRKIKSELHGFTLSKILEIGTRIKSITTFLLILEYCRKYLLYSNSTHKKLKCRPHRKNGIAPII